MNAVFLMFVIFVGGDGSESLETANQMQYSTLQECESDLDAYSNTKNVTFFCGDSDLYVNGQQAFF